MTLKGHVNMIDIFKIKAGDKVKFKGVGPHWFLDMIENGKKLTAGKVYTISSKRIASSWTCITLEETGDKEYSLGWFTLV